MGAMTFNWTTPPWERQDCTHMATTLTKTGGVVSQSVRGDNAVEALADLLMGPGGAGVAALVPSLIGVVVRRGIDMMWLAQPRIRVAPRGVAGAWNIAVDSADADVTAFSAGETLDLLTRLQATYPPDRRALGGIALLRRVIRGGPRRRRPVLRGF